MGHGPRQQVRHCRAGRRAITGHNGDPDAQIKDRSMLSRRLLLTGLFMFTLLGTRGLAQAQIRIGQTAGLTGAVAALSS